MHLDLTPVLVAVITAAGLVASALIAARQVGGHVKEIRRQVTPAGGRTFAAELADHRKELAGVARSVATLALEVRNHSGDDLRHRPAQRGAHHP